MKGFIACDPGGNPISLELSDEIIGGLAIAEPFPVFLDANDAEEAVLSNQSRYGSKATFEIRHVELVIGEIHHTAEYDESKADEEVDDE